MASGSPVGVAVGGGVSVGVLVGGGVSDGVGVGGVGPSRLTTMVVPSLSVRKDQGYEILFPYC